MSEHASFYAAILKAPKDNLPRLVYADWLDEQGDPRGEFIRLQIDLVGKRCHELPTGECDIDGRTHPRPLCQVCTLLRRGRQLQIQHGRSWSTLLVHVIRGSNIHSIQSDHQSCSLGYRWDFSRGFISSITCTADDWLTHGDALCANLPLENVTLTTMPDIELIRGDNDFGFHSRVSGRVLWDTLGNEPVDNVMAMALHKVWWTVAFTLPESPTFNLPAHLHYLLDRESQPVIEEEEFTLESS